jgi:hypothetical protein
MKKKPDRRIVVAVLVVVTGAAAAKGLEVQKPVKNPLPGVTWPQSRHP